MDAAERQHLLLQVAAHLKGQKPDDTGSLIAGQLLQCSIEHVEDSIIEVTDGFGDISTTKLRRVIIYMTAFEDPIYISAGYVDVEADINDQWFEVFRREVKDAFKKVLGVNFLILRFKIDNLIDNQNPLQDKPVIFQGMRFSSPAEVSIAQALEKAEITYLPNCLIRVGGRQYRKSYFPDFLICHNGKWGILEVDGKPFHTPSSATDDHVRSQELQLHARVYLTRFPASDCLKDPDTVIKRFLKLLEQNG